MIVLDASVLIAHLDPADVHHGAAGRLLLEAADEEWGSSPLTLAEVLVGPARVGQLALARSALDDLGVITVPLDGEAPAALAMLRAETGLRLPGCCVLLAAQSTKATVATFDARLAAVARELGLG